MHMHIPIHIPIHAATSTLCLFEIQFIITCNFNIKTDLFNM